MAQPFQYINKPAGSSFVQSTYPLNYSGPLKGCQDLCKSFHNACRNDSEIPCVFHNLWMLKTPIWNAILAHGLQ